MKIVMRDVPKGRLILILLNSALFTFVTTSLPALCKQAMTKRVNKPSPAEKNYNLILLFSFRHRLRKPNYVIIRSATDYYHNVNHSDF